MKVLSLKTPPVEGIVTRAVTGAGSAHGEVRFNLWLCRVQGAESVDLVPPAGIQEQLLYVIRNHGLMRDGHTLRELAPLHAYRVPVTAGLELQSSKDKMLELLYLASPQSPPACEADEADLGLMEGIQFPACRWGRSITNGGSPIKAAGFTAGLSILAPRGGQVPWHNHPDRQNEVYLLLSGRGQMCVGTEVRELTSPSAVFVPGDQWHQLTNLHASESLHLIYCYEGSVAAPHWWQERDGVLPVSGEAPNPPLPSGAFPQCTLRDSSDWARVAAEYWDD